MRLIAAVFSVVMSMMKSMAINLIGDSAGRVPLTQNLHQIESETSSMALLSVSLAVHGLPYLITMEAMVGAGDYFLAR